MRNLGIYKIRSSSQYASTYYAEIRSSWNIVFDNMVRGMNAEENETYVTAKI
jgi:hypothetical protein